MAKKKVSSALARYEAHGAFAETALGACFTLSASDNTRRAYWSDARRWLDFCRSRGLDPARVDAVAVAAWVEVMKAENDAPKTRNRRLSALSSIYDRLRRKHTVEVNPFSVEDGPKRERAHTLAPTPAASPEAVRGALEDAQADHSFNGVRDVALLRLLWATGARRGSLEELTQERLQMDGDSYYCVLPAKGGKEVRLWIAGRAADAVRELLRELRGRHFVKGPVFRLDTGSPMQARDIWRAVRRRGRHAGFALKPHSFRVTFLTVNPAALDARQDAAGHADPETTRLYDRSWRGRAAFEAMPEIEEVANGVA